MILEISKLSIIQIIYLFMQNKCYWPYVYLFIYLFIYLSIFYTGAVKYPNQVRHV